MTERDLAAVLAGSPGAALPGDVSCEEVHITLRHGDLPRLAEAGCITWDVTAGTVTAADHLALDAIEFTHAFETADRGVDGGDALTSTGRRRCVLEVLVDRAEPLQRATLAHEVAACEAGGAPATEEVAAVEVALHHVHLPTLEAAGLVEYDPDTGTVASLDHRGSQ